LRVILSKGKYFTLTCLYQLLGISSGIVREAQVCVECMHRFCKECIETSMNNTYVTIS